jgi:glycosyltransferase involved in cell wall biosynthesis
MNIGFDFRMGGSINSGIGRYVFEVLTHIAKQDANNSFYVFYNTGNVDEKDLAALKAIGNVHLVATNIRHYSLMEQLWFPRILQKYPLDIMHFPNFNVPVLYNKPFIVTIHDMVHHKISGHKKSRWLHFQAYKYIIEQAAKKSERIITVTNFAKKEIMHYLGVPDGKITVIYEAPSLEPVDQSKVEKVKKTYLLNKPYFIFVGTLERKKNVINLTKAFDQFLDKSKRDLDLVIVGKADKHYPDIKFKALEIRHRDRVIFTDFVENEDLAALYQGAYAFISASLHEGFGLPGVEAMQFGVPILASNTEVFNEVYDNAAIYFDPLNLADIAEKMALVAGDQQFHQTLQQKSLDRGTLFDWDKPATQTLEVYKEVFANRKPTVILDQPEDD